MGTAPKFDRAVIQWRLAMRKMVPDLPRTIESRSLVLGQSFSSTSLGRRRSNSKGRRPFCADRAQHTPNEALRESARSQSEFRASIDSGELRSGTRKQESAELTERIGERRCCVGFMMTLRWNEA